ncbi:unnamed protein product [Litomosoides sigmodontis]|uniref:Uncharacterized protein n=1 Tax=Litomosoides sigmodontis TaxID=42156 RepID=A0A3P6UVP1_LITSI|nr:unnamed protein product [Litomosoides sigmodontis]
MSMRSMDSRLEVLRNGQDVANKSLLYSAGSIQQPQQQLPNDVDNESNKSDSWVELANPSSRASMVSINGGDNGSVIMVDNDGVVMSTENTPVVVGGGSGSPFSRLSPVSGRSAPFELVIDAGQVHGGNPMGVQYYNRHGPGRCTVTATGITGLAQGTKRTAEWLEDYNSRPEVQRGGPQAPSPVETEMSTPPNSLVPGLDVGDLTQSSCCEEDEELSVEDDGVHMCRCKKVTYIGQEGRWTFSGLLGINSGNGRRALVLYLVTNLVTLAIGFAVGLTVGLRLGLLHDWWPVLSLIVRTRVTWLHLCERYKPEAVHFACWARLAAFRMAVQKSDSSSSAEISEVTEIEKSKSSESIRSEISSGSSTAKTVAENDLEKFSFLYDKYSTQCNELERLQKENSELEEQLQKVRGECDNVQEVLDASRSEFATRRKNLERRIRDLELQLKLTTQHVEAREQHCRERIKQNNAKWDQKFVEQMKKMEAIEKEKNDAVCRYATREAQIMRLQTRVEELEVQNNKLSVEENTLQSSTQFENLQDAVSQTVFTELRSRLEFAQSQLILKEREKEECQEELKKAQAMLKKLEQQCAEEMDAAIKKTNNQEELYNNACNELISLRSHNSTLCQELEHVKQTNAQLHAESQQLNQELEQSRQAHQVASEKLKSLEEIQAQLNSNIRRVKLSEIAAMEAAAERDQAEAEAAECRKQAERMLEITKQLADKNSSLTSQQEVLRLKNLELNQLVQTLETSVSTYEKRIAELQQELEVLKIKSSAEIGVLQQKVDANIDREHKLNAVINELHNGQEILRKKNASSLKELRAEVQHLRKLLSGSLSSSSPNASVEDNIPLPAMPNDAAESSTSSRASSIPSATDVRPGAVPHREASQQSQTAIIDHARAFQQQMIEKIVKLQRQLARRQEKLEFLEEHVRHCTEELVRKTKIIQNYALREEASLLLPVSDVNRLLETCEATLPRGPRDRSSASSSLIGNLFASSANNATGTSDVATEVNSRLQAVLENALHRNITLKDNIDTLGEEISRLSRENRQLTLSKMM